MTGEVLIPESVEYPVQTFNNGRVSRELEQGFGRIRAKPAELRLSKVLNLQSNRETC